MANFHTARVGLVAVGALFFLRPIPVSAQDGLPTQPAVTPGHQGKIDNVTLQGRTFKQGRTVDTTSTPGHVSVNVDIWAPDGGGSRVNMQLHTTIKYQWTMTPPPDPKGGQSAELSGDSTNESVEAPALEEWTPLVGGKGESTLGLMGKTTLKELTELVDIKTTLQNFDTGKTITPRDDSYQIDTEFQRPSRSTIPYVMAKCKGKSDWRSDGGPVGNFSKTVHYYAQSARDDKSWLIHQVDHVDTNYVDDDPVGGPWTYERKTRWDSETGQVLSHTVDINGEAPPNPYTCAMLERGVVANGMAANVGDPSVPGLSGIPFEWPTRQR